MKIGVSGTHGTGKTFTVYKLANEYKEKFPEKKISVVTEIARKCPFEINEKCNENSQQWILSSQIKEEIESEKNNDIVITDRTIVDTIAYTYLTSDKKLFYSFIPYLEYYIKTYDLILYKDINKNNYCFDDGVRSTDPIFRINVDIILKHVYNDFNKKGLIKKFKII